MSATFTNSRIWRPYTQQQTALPPIALESARGAHLFSKDGRKIFDGISSWWVITHGHCHPMITEAVQRQIEKLDQVIFANFTHDPAEELSERLLARLPKRLARVFFTDNGSTAIESGLKMCLQACAQSGSPGKRKFVTLEHAYHGDTVGAMSVSGAGPYTRPYDSLLFEVLRAPHPTLSTATIDSFTDGLESILNQQHAEICGVIVEPLVQGAGGMIIWPAAALKKIEQLCRKFKIYLIFDEVMTGFGRTGSMFAMDRCNVEPDVACFSKGITGGVLPLAATIVSEAIYEHFLSASKERMLFHGHSFTGNPISCAAAVANLKIFDTTDIFERLHEMEIQQRDRVTRLKRFSCVQDPRSCGTIAAFNVLDPEKSAGISASDFGVRYQSGFSEFVTAQAMKHNVFLRPLGNTIYCLPPYCATSEDLDQVWDVIESIVDEFDRDGFRSL